MDRIVSTRGTHWLANPAIATSAALHVAALGGVALRPSAWPLALAAVVANHLVLTAAGLWPRSRPARPQLHAPAARERRAPRGSHHHRRRPGPRGHAAGARHAGRGRRARQLLRDRCTARATPGARSRDPAPWPHARESQPASPPRLLAHGTRPPARGDRRSLRRHPRRGRRAALLPRTRGPAQSVPCNPCSARPGCSSPAGRGVASTR